MTKEIFIKDFINYFGSKNLTERGFEQPFGTITIIGSLLPICEKQIVNKKYTIFHLILGYVTVIIKKMVKLKILSNQSLVQLKRC